MPAKAGSLLVVAVLVTAAVAMLEVGPAIIHPGLDLTPEDGLVDGCERGRRM